jgi:hypothetical protein
MGEWKGKVKEGETYYGFPTSKPEQPAPQRPLQL